MADSSIALGAGGTGTGGGGLHFRIPVDVFADAAARSNYFTTTEPAAYNLFVNDRALTIVLGTIAMPTFYTYVGGGAAYDDAMWMQRVDAVEGRPGEGGPQGVGDYEIYLNAATLPTAQATGGSIAANGVLTLPTVPAGVTALPTAVGTGENTYAAKFNLNPRTASFPVTPIWSVWYEIGNPAGAQAAQNAAEAALASALAAQADAETARDMATVSATASAGSATDAAAQATAAAGSVVDATTQATASAGSATDAAAQAAAAAGSVTDATAQATAAAASAAAAAAAAQMAAADSDGTVLFGTDDPPAGTLGNIGDSYWTTTSPNKVFKRGAGGWVLQFTVTASGGQTITDDVYFGLSADDVPLPAELTISGVNGAAVITPFTDMYMLIARLESEGDITSVLFSDDSTQTNALGAFTKYGTTVIPTGETEAFSVWVSNQILSQYADATVTVS